MSLLLTGSRTRDARNSSIRSTFLTAGLLTTGTCLRWLLSANRSLVAAGPEWMDSLLFLPSPPDSTTAKTVDPSYSLAYSESLGFFDDIPNAHWRLQNERIRSEGLFYDTSNPENGVDQSVALWMLNNVDPLLTCPHTRRVGGRGDGPKWVCDPHRLRRYSDCLVYSIGSAGNYQFEDGLAGIVGEKHCEIHVFDPNPRFARPGDVTNRNIHYHAWGLKSSYSNARASRRTRRSSKRAQFYPLAETMQQLGHTGRRIDIFKIDCEGCEWISYKDWISESVDIRQIQIEIHADTMRPAEVTLSGFFQALFDRGFVPFAKEANTHPAAKPPGTLFEFAFLRLDSSFYVR